MAKSFSHKFGQTIGDLLELALLPYFEKFSRKHKLYLDKKGTRKARSGKKVTWKDAKGNKHDLDLVLERGGKESKIGNPVAFIESAWRRGTRHSKNKVQEIQAAINPIVQLHHESVCFKGAILGGDFTAPSLVQLQSDNFTVLHFPTSIFVAAFKKFNLDIISSDTTEEAEFERRIQIWEGFSNKEKLYETLVKLNKNAVKTFFNSLSNAVSRSIDRIIILPLHGQESTLNNVLEALEYLKKYSENKMKLPITKYEVTIKYNTGDRIEAVFKDKKDCMKFLEGYK
jgi:hypothetical protein